MKMKTLHFEVAMNEPQSSSLQREGVSKVNETQNSLLGSEGITRRQASCYPTYN